MLDSKEEILERLKVHSDTDWKDMVYSLRLVTANFLDITTRNAKGRPQQTDGRFVPILKRGWEEGRHNPVQINTQIQVKSLSFQRPELRWENCDGADPEVTSEVRRGYYHQLWDDNSLMQVYQAKLLDMLICGEGSFFAGVRNGKIFGEHGDALDVTWDKSSGVGARRRFVFRDKHIPLSKAAQDYPDIVKYEPWQVGAKGGEKMVTVVCYWSETTSAVIYKGKFLKEPEANAYGTIPARSMVLFQELSVRHPSGQVEAQLGPANLLMRLMRKARDVALRGSPVGVGVGLEENDLDRIASGEEGVVVKANSNGSFGWTAGPETSKTDIEVINMMQQFLNTASGVNDFMQGRTDTKVDFATQLSLLASQSGITGQYAASIFEQGIKDDAELLMLVGERFQGPISIGMTGETVSFDAFTPINPLLGADGDIYLKPGGMSYKSPMQKLQEASILANTLTMASGLPPGISDRFIDLALTAFEIDNKAEWMESYQLAQQQQMMAEQMALGANPQDFGQRPETANPQGQLAAS